MSKKCLKKVMSFKKIYNFAKFYKKNKITEANIQAEFYYFCKLNNINCYLEFKLEKCRFDAVIFDENYKIRYIIEFKSYKTEKKGITNTKQLNKYRKFNCEVILITRLEQIDDVQHFEKRHVGRHVVGDVIDKTTSLGGATLPPDLQIEAHYL